MSPSGPLRATECGFRAHITSYILSSSITIIFVHRCYYLGKIEGAITPHFKALAQNGEELTSVFASSHLDAA
jgi:hypothetical protein